jgi:CRISPR/Cas system CSM-associated protein Csm3 (group 7 of RAMP superfamily)
MTNKYNTRIIANIVIEAKTPLKVGSSYVDMLQDAPVQKDWNNLPMILGTSIAGVLRKEFEHKFANEIFGDEQSKKTDNKGSRIIISNALLCDKNMQVHESLLLEKTDFLKHFDILPVREHVRITDKGVADSANSGKFDEEVVYKGSRFKFRIELIADENDATNFQEILKVLNSKVFRLGGGTTKGFGDIEVLHALSSYDVFTTNSQEYREKSSSLNTAFSKALSQETKEDIAYTCYTLKLTADDFFMFGSGFGDDDADMTPVYEEVLDYDKEGLSTKKILIPASSLKGAIAHRTTYHYNKANSAFVGNAGALKNVVAIFGEEKQIDEKRGSKGKIILSDCFLDDKNKTKTFDHVSIDRFTGGAIEGALFQEKTIAYTDEWSVEILLHKSVDGNALQAFESTLSDITTGMLALGGATTKGHGTFSGSWSKNGK